MINVEEYIESFKQISKDFQKISKSFERYEDKFNDIEVFKSEIKKKVRDLELVRGRSDENQDIELQQVQFNEGSETEEKLERIEKCEKKLGALYARVESLERLSSRDRPVNNESEGVASQQQENSQGQQVETKTGKWHKIKTKSIEYFKSISIPGISQIVTTDSHLLKLLWTVLILVTFGCGVQNISLAVTDYYNYDKITNIERVTPDNVTFPATTLCTWIYQQEYYLQNKYVSTSFIPTTSLNVSLINGFITDSYFSGISANKWLDFFTIPKLNRDCFRFNAIANKSVELLRAKSSTDVFQVHLNNYFIDHLNAALNEYYNYSLFGILVFIGNNHLNSFEKLQPFNLEINNLNLVKIQKESTETKLPPPFNPCQEFAGGELYHRWNCVEACVARETKSEFDCTFPLSLFRVHGYTRCNDSGQFYWEKFSGVCQAECPLDDCFSEKFMYDLQSIKYPVGTLLQFAFRDLSTLNITQIPKTDAFTFLNNIGGGLGLFMGIALPNLLEFLQFMVDIIVIAFVR